MDTLDAALEHRCFTEHAHDARKQTIEHKQLPTARKLDTRLRRITQPLFQRGFESRRRRVRPWLHTSSPVVRSNAVACGLLTIPRASA